MPTPTWNCSGRQVLAQHADAEWRLRRVCQGAVDATGRRSRRTVRRGPARRPGSVAGGPAAGDRRRPRRRRPRRAAQITAMSLLSRRLSMGMRASYAAAGRPPSHDLIILWTVEMARSPFVGYTTCRRSLYNRGYPREQEIPHPSAHRHRRDRRGVRRRRRLSRPEAGRLLPAGLRSSRPASTTARTSRSAGRVVDGSIARDDSRRALHHPGPHRQDRHRQGRPTAGRCRARSSDGVDVVIVGKYAAADGVIVRRRAPDQVPEQVRGQGLARGSDRDSMSSRA